MAAQLALPWWFGILGIFAFIVMLYPLWADFAVGEGLLSPVVPVVMTPVQWVFAGIFLLAVWFSRKDLERVIG